MGATERPLDGRVALVTGGNQGIGAATALALARDGAAVLVSYLATPAPDEPADDGLPERYARDRAQDAEQVLGRIRAAGGRADAVEADLTDPQTPRRLFDAAEQAFGPVEILVSNASGWVQDTFAADARDAIGRPMAAVTAATFDAQFAVDARAGALLIGELARRHVARGARWGRIVTLSSGGPDGFPTEVSYGAAKAALENYTMSAAQELGRHGITANVVVPGVTDTGWVADEHRAALADHSPLRSVAEPEQVADVIAFLCGDAAGRVTGNVVRLR